MTKLEPCRGKPKDNNTLHVGRFFFSCSLISFQAAASMHQVPGRHGHFMRTNTMFKHKAARIVSVELSSWVVGMAPRHMADWRPAVTRVGWDHPRHVDRSTDRGTLSRWHATCKSFVPRRDASHHHCVRHSLLN